MKKLTAIFISLVILCTQSASADTYYENKTSEYITKGILHTYSERFSSSGWERVNVLEVDLSDKNISLKTLYSEKGISTLENVKSMAEKAGAAAAVNGDFFNWSPTSPLGLTATNSEIISSPSHDTGLAALMENQDGNIFIDYFQMNLSVIAPNGSSCPIIHINKYHSMQSIVLFTSAFGVTPGSADNVCEMVVCDGKVLEIRENLEGIIPPENGYVLATSLDVNTFFKDNFEVGSPVELDFSITPDYGKIKTAVGGGTVLVSQGKVFPFTNNVSGYAPRTAAGVSQDGKTLYLVTVDGRTTATQGMNQTQLANLLIEIGAYNAINLDGGGSTTMVAQNLNGDIEVKNNPSGSLRNVSTALAVMGNHPKGKLSGFKISSSKENVFIGDYTEITVSPFDEYFNKTETKYTFSSNDGYFNGNLFYPEKEGVCTISVTSGKIKETFSVNCLKEIHSVKTDESNIIGIDENGFESIISNPDLVKEENEFSDTKNVAKKGKTFYLAPELFDEKTLFKQLLNTKITESLDEKEILLDVSEYSETREGSTLFVTLDSSKKSFRSSNEDAWNKIIDISKNTTAKNVFFVTAYSPDDFSDKAEALLFNKTLSENLFKRGINVYVVSKGKNQSITAKNGVKYITLPKISDISTADFKEKAENVQALCIYVDNDTVGYEFETLLP